MNRDALLIVRDAFEAEVERQQYGLPRPVRTPGRGLYRRLSTRFGLDAVRRHRRAIERVIDAVTDQMEVIAL